MRVLLIEDEALLAKTIKLVLGRAGFDVHTADLGKEGLALARTYDHDIILLDLSLPDMHGHDVLTGLRAAGVTTPVLVLSGQSETDAKVRALRCGADEFMTKPFHRDELIACINAVRANAPQEPQTLGLAA